MTNTNPTIFITRKKNNKFMVRFTTRNSQSRYFGTYDTLQEAVTVRNEKILRYGSPSQKRKIKGLNNGGSCFCPHFDCEKELELLERTQSVERWVPVVSVLFATVIAFLLAYVLVVVLKWGL